MALIGICFFKKTKTGSITRSSSDRLLNPLLAKLALLAVLLDVLGAREDSEGSGKTGISYQNRFESRAAEPPRLFQLGIFIPCQ